MDFNAVSIKLGESFSWKRLATVCRYMQAFWYMSNAVAPNLLVEQKYAHRSSLTSHHHLLHEGVLRICLRHVSLDAENVAGLTYHRFDVWVRHSIEFVIVEFQLGTDVDVSTLVLCAVTVLGSRED